MHITLPHPMAATLARAHQITQARRFAVDVLRPDGIAESFERIGGSTIDHAREGADRAGEGGVVRVLELSSVVSQ